MQENNTFVIFATDDYNTGNLKLRENLLFLLHTRLC